MHMRQYYYTSYIQQGTGQAGFQIKAMSPGISSTLQSTIARLIDYHIPPDLNVNAVETHPVALRYVYTEAGESVLLCSQSSGQDEYGRPGNFFAHAIVLGDRSSLTSTPPVFFWKSPLWRSSDSEERREVVSLPLLPSFEMEPTLDAEKIRSFLAQEARYDWLSKLLCAVIQYGKTQRKLVILDTDEHIALWIAAVSYLLPSAYRPLLTFTTYHHDPGHTPYLITGTTSKSLLRAILADSHSYFLLDATTGSVSPVEPSPYARLAVQALRSDRYETWLLPLLTTFERRFPQPAAIDEQLDLLALYTRIHISPLQEAFTAETHRAIQVALTSFTTHSQFFTEDSDELNRIERHLRRTVKQSTQSDVHATYQKVLSLLKEHFGSIDDIILEELKLFAEQLIVSQFQTSAPISLSILHDLYGFQEVLHMVNSPVYLRWATQSLPDNIRANLECLIALTGGTMTPQLIPQVQRTLEHLATEEYLAMLEVCLPAFFSHPVSDDAHLNLIHALYPRGIQLMITERFWQIYQNTLGTLLQQPSTKEKAVRLLDFWFATPPSILPQGYPVQRFFLLLPTCELLQAGQFKIDSQHSSVLSRPWYSSLQFALAQRHNIITTASHTSLSEYFLTTLHRGWEMSGKRRSHTTQTLNTEIRRLFEKDQLISHHCQLTQLYKEFSAERFWASYWKEFLRLLTTRESESVLAVFSFWFEHAYLEFTSPSIPQEFFLGLFRALRSASKVQGFYETLQDIYEKVQREQTLHPDRHFTWFPLIMSLTRWRPR